MQQYQYVVSAKRGRQFSYEKTWCLVDAVQLPCSSKDVPSPQEAGDRNSWMRELAVDTGPSPSSLVGEETTTKGCVGV